MALNSGFPNLISNGSSNLRDHGDLGNFSNSLYFPLCRNKSQFYVDDWKLFCRGFNAVI